MAFTIIFVAIVIAAIIFDIFSRNSLSTPVPGIILFSFFCHSFAIVFLLPKIVKDFSALLLIAVYAAIIYCFISFLFYSFNRNKLDSARLKVMMGGQRMLFVIIISTCLQLILSPWFNNYFNKKLIDPDILNIDAYVDCALIIFFSIVAVLRIVLTSKELGVFWRIIFLVFGWIPILNIPVAIYCGHKVGSEYLSASVTEEIKRAKKANDSCSTKFPILFLYNSGFFQNANLDFWGKVPRFYKINGAEVYYLKLDSAQSIETNAAKIKETVDMVLKDFNCEKVNIIAQYKTGIEARYMICRLNKENTVASLTTINTPHYGFALADIVRSLSYNDYKFICSRTDSYLVKHGDLTADSYRAVKQLTTKSVKRFNKRNKNLKTVYYQSYYIPHSKTIIKNIFTHIFSLEKFLSGSRKSYVSEQAVKWGEYKGVIEPDKGIVFALKCLSGKTYVKSGGFKNKFKRIIAGHRGKLYKFDKYGISHQYAEIAGELKKMGY